MTAARLDPVDLSSLDLSRHRHLHGVFAPVTSEIDMPDLRVDGELPAELDGDYIRNGPNPRFTPMGSYTYPLDGDGMLHRVQFREGRVRYTNRFVRTPGLVCEEAAGRALWPGTSDHGYTPGAEVVGPALAHTRKDAPHINVVRHGGRLLALAESASPFVISPQLDTLERETFGGMLPAGMTAHPKIDPVTGDMVIFRCDARSAPYLTWSVIGSDGVPTRVETPVHGVTRPSMIHDMALTATYVVLVLGPLYLDPSLPVAGGLPLSWEPEEGTRIALIPRAGGVTTWLSTDPLWLWHTANAHDATAPDGVTTVVLDYVRWSAPGVGSVPMQGSLSRMTLHPGTGAVTHQQLVDRDMEFPRIDDRAVTNRHRIIATSLKTGLLDLPTGEADTLGWYDTHTGDFDTWGAGTMAVGEQIYLPVPGDPDPTHGWWGIIATSRDDLSSRLILISAQDPTAGPIATVHLPQRVPLGLHGVWLPTDE